MIIVHNDHLLDYMRKNYHHHDIVNLEKYLHKSGVFHFHRLSNGLFPASGVPDDNDVSGYQYVWVRDNVHIAYALHKTGDTESSVKMIVSMLKFFQLQEPKITKIIKNGTKPDDPMDRPHIRFDGDHLTENEQKWPHAQNDALGYFLWLTGKLINEGCLKPTEEEINLLLSFFKYFSVIQYWNDEDSGHWEEIRKISASSIGTVLAGLYEFSKVNERQHLKQDHLLKDLINRGEKILLKILPHECIQEDKIKQRKYDAALLFLMYPLQLPTIDGDLENEILSGIQNNLAGRIGIRRYLGDSYWCADYKQLFAPSDRTDDFSDNMESRDKHLKPGQEAQWCIFDSIMSCIYGIHFKSSMNIKDYHLQCRYFNRALGQITGEESTFGCMKCPEAYYIEDGEYVENDHTPLLWAQANLLQAVTLMKASSRIFDDIGKEGNHG